MSDGHGLSLQQDDADRWVGHRVLEYCGASDGGAPSCVYLAALTPLSDGPGVWDSAPRFLPDAIEGLMRAGADLARSILGPAQPAHPPGRRLPERGFSRRSLSPPGRSVLQGRACVPCGPARLRQVRAAAARPDDRPGLSLHGHRAARLRRCRSAGRTGAGGAAVVRYARVPQSRRAAPGVGRQARASLRGGGHARRVSDAQDPAAGGAARALCPSCSTAPW